MLLLASVRRGRVVAACVVDSKRQQVAGAAPCNERAWLQREAPVLDSGVAVASVILQAPTAPLVRSVLWAAAVGALLGLTVWWLVIRVAVGSLARSMRELQVARQEAERAGRARTAFLATMSHEIRTPMNGVIGMTRLLRDTTLEPQQRHFVEVIRGSGESLLKVINEILEFTKVESGRTLLEPQAFQPELLAEEVLVLLEPVARHKGLKLACEVEPGLPLWMWADVGRLRQLLVNLVGNAIKFSDAGEVRVKVQLRAAERLRNTVIDNGIGMDAEQVERIFEPFMQGDASTSRRFGGTGLGLAISRRLAVLMGGSIDVTSQPGQGSTFVFDVLAPPALAPIDASDIPGVEVLMGRHVLIVDDNPVNVEIVQNMTRAWGMLPVGHCNAQAAL